MANRNNQRIAERDQERIDAGFLSALFPGVKSIVIKMNYKHKGANLIKRILKFQPDSYAFFRITCLSKDCVDGCFDLTPVIRSMIRNQRREEKGDLGCDDSGPHANHANIVYTIAIRYA